MTLETILRILRADLDDEVGADSKKLWKNWQLVVYINQAVEEIAKELLCLTADDVVTETAATGTITLSGTAGQISSVTINGPNLVNNAVVTGYVITSAAIPFTVDLPTTAAALAANINAYAVNTANTNPIKFTASANGAIVTITAPAGTGATPNGYAILPVGSGGMSFTSTTLSGGDCLCRLFLVPGQTRYYFGQKVIKISRFKPESLTQPIGDVTKQIMDATVNDWQNAPAGPPLAYIPDYENRKITVYPAPDIAYTVDLDVVTLPLTPLDLSAMTGVPAIREEYQIAIFPWARHLAYQKPDRETLNVEKAMLFANPTSRTGEFYHHIELIKQRMKLSQMSPIGGFSHPGMY